MVKEGALADRLFVDGNPLEDIDRVADPESSFVNDREGWNWFTRTWFNDKIDRNSMNDAQTFLQFATNK